ncbi:MAG: PEP-CTERM sorting domain-containing protein [Pirellulales bacterium]|nr:PEP-CTERM sorting domain-containing protein [Pirellulales bacterium]
MKFRTMAGMWLVSLGCSLAQAGPLISEIYFNPPGGNDSPATNALEYIELCGPANQALDNRYLIIIENENDEFNSQNPGEIEGIFNLANMTFGDNGFLVLGMKNPAYPGINDSVAFDDPTIDVPGAPTIAESLKTLANGAHAYINRDTGAGYGNGPTSSIGYTGQGLDLEGSGFTAMLIEVDPAIGSAPVLNDDLDVGNNGLDVVTGQAGWTILDSIGVFGEADEPEFGRLYAEVNFGPGPLGLAGIGGIEPGAQYINTLAQLAEIEYIGRVGGGSTPADWMVANLTDNAATGFTAAARNYAISGNHAQLNDAEVYVGSTAQPAAFPYGTDITVSFGTDNVGSVPQHPVPEPSSFVLLACGGAFALAVRRRWQQP